MRHEQERANRLAAAVDALLRDPGGPLPAADPADASLLSTARRLANLPALLGGASPALEARILGRRAEQRRAPAGRAWSPRPSLAWAVAGLATALLLLALFTPLGQSAAAGFRSVFRLGRTEVRITPVDSAEPHVTAAAPGTSLARRLTLEEAGQQVPFALLLPADLPDGFALQSVTGFTYTSLPAWVPQPFSVELIYADAEGRSFTVCLYPITLGQSGRLSTSALNLKAAEIQGVQPVDVDGKPGVLLKVSAGSALQTWQELVWEQSDLILSISSLELDEEQLLRIARSVQ